MWGVSPKEDEGVQQDAGRSREGALFRRDAERYGKKLARGLGAQSKRRISER